MDFLPVMISARWCEHIYSYRRYDAYDVCLQLISNPTANCCSSIYVAMLLIPSAFRRRLGSRHDESDGHSVSRTIVLFPRLYICGRSRHHMHPPPPAMLRVSDDVNTHPRLAPPIIISTWTLLNTSPSQQARASRHKTSEAVDGTSTNKILLWISTASCFTCNAAPTICVVPSWCWCPSLPGTKHR